MPRIQFSLRTLLFGFIPIGLAIAALANADERWANATFTATLACLGAAIVGWIWCVGRARAFWSGFAIFGCGYMLLAFGPWSDRQVPGTLTTYWLLQKSAGLFKHDADLSETPSPWQNKSYSLEVDSWQNPSAVGRMKHYWDYIFVGHCLFTLLSGLAGGLIAKWFYARREIQAKDGPLEDRPN